MLRTPLTMPDRRWKRSAVLVFEQGRSHATRDSARAGQMYERGWSSVRGRPDWHHDALAFQTIRQCHLQELIPRQWALHQLEDPFVDRGLTKLRDLRGPPQ